MDAEVIALTAGLIADPSRSQMLIALFDAEELTAGELAHRADISPQTASAHLAKLCRGRLLTLKRVGRHRYYRLASTEVARAVEALAATAAQPDDELPLSNEVKPLQFARTCYDHLAGRLGVALTEACVDQGWLTWSEDKLDVTENGNRAFGTLLGISVVILERQRRALVRPCMDWTEKRPHIAGAVGAALTQALFERRWLLRSPHSRVVFLTNEGRKSLARGLAVRI